MCDAGMELVADISTAILLHSIVGARHLGPRGRRDDPGLLQFVVDETAQEERRTEGAADAAPT